MLVAAICTGKGDTEGDHTNLVVCYPDTNLHTALELMRPLGLHQLPVVTRVGTQWQDRGHKVVGVLNCEAIPDCIKYVTLHSSGHSNCGDVIIQEVLRC